MRKAAVKADLLRPRRKFSLLYDHESKVLDSLPCWMTRLFLHLVRLSDFRSGQGMTTFAQLVELMTPLQPARGPRFYVPDEQAVRKAVVAFEERRIVARDKGTSINKALLFFVVLDRGVNLRPAPKLEGVTRRGVDNRKASNGAASGPVAQ